MNARVLKGLLLAVLGLGAIWMLALHRSVPQHKSPYNAGVDRATLILLRQEQSTVVFKKSSGAWRVSKSESGPFYPADEDRVASLLGGLGALQLEEVLSDRAERLGDFQADDVHGARVTLRDDKGLTLADGIFGKQSDDAIHIYFRYPNDSNVWLARGLTRAELGRIVVAQWRSHTLMTLSEPQIKAVTIETQAWTTALMLSSTTWLLGGKLAQPDKVNQLLGALAHLQCSEFVDPALGPSWDALREGTLTAKSVDKTVSLRIGVYDAKRKQYPVAHSEAEGVTWVDEARMKAILLKPSDLKAK